MDEWWRFDGQFREDPDESAARWRRTRAKLIAEGKCWQCAKLVAECQCPNIARKVQGAQP